MNRKIPFHELSSLLATNCNITPDEAEDFVKSFFDLIAQTLVSGETVKIKGIGTFSPTGDADNPIDFTPDTTISDTINAPFALFEPEEVSDTLSDAQFADIDEQESVEEPVSEDRSVDEAEPETKPTIKPETEVVIEPEPIPSEETVVVSEPEIVTETTAETPISPSVEASITVPTETPVSTPIQPSVTAHVSAPVSAAAPAPVSSFPEEEPEEYYTEPTQKSGGGFGMGFLIGMLVGLALGACAVYFAIDYIFPTSSSNIDSIENSIVADDPLTDMLIEPTDTIAIPVDTQSTDTVAPAVSTPDAPVEEQKVEQSKSEPTADAIQTVTTQAVAPTANKTVKDTIKKGYLLNDMAKKHFGNKCFWVYIYEENKAKIANPNRVSAGLELVIPDPAKYGIDATSQASINAANEKAGKILSKFSR